MTRERNPLWLPYISDWRMHMDDLVTGVETAIKRER